MNNIIIKILDLRGGYWEVSLEQCRRVYDPQGISPTIMASMDGSNEKSIKIICKSK